VGFACKFRKAWWTFASILFIWILIAEVTGWGVRVDPITGKVYHPLVATVGLWNLTALVELATRGRCKPKPQVVSTPVGPIMIVYKDATDPESYVDHDQRFSKHKRK
jgi:hypothetical protein